jgi:DNA polymerase-3 subunit gamma/tau
MARGSDAAVVLEELLDLTYWVSTIKTCPALKQDMTWPESDRHQGALLADKLPLPNLMQAWQILSKGYEEVARSPLPSQAVEMVLLRLCYLSKLPSAEELLSLIHNKPITAPTMASAMQLTPSSAPQLPKTFEELVQLVANAREPMIHTHLIHDVRLISYAPGKLEVTVNDRTPKNFGVELSKLLQNLTQVPWQILTNTQTTTQPTLAEQHKAQQQSLTEQSLNHPIVKQLAEAFPGSTIAVKP